MFRGKVILPSLLGLALILSLVSSAEARGWRLNFFGLHIYGGYSPRSVAHGYFPRSVVDRRNVANVVETERARTGGGAVGALLDRLVRGCLQQAAGFRAGRMKRSYRLLRPTTLNGARLRHCALRRPRRRSVFPPTAHGMSRRPPANGLWRRSRRSTP